MKRYDGYWGEKPHLDGITFKALIDQTSRTASLESGDVDLIFTQDPAAVTKFRSKDGYIQVEDFAAEETFAMLNLGDAPFDNIHARRALAYATDPDAVNNTDRWWHPRGGRPAVHLRRAVLRARRRLCLVRHGQGRRGSRGLQERHRRVVVVVLAQDPVRRHQKAEAELLQAQWSAVGIDASLNETEQSAFLATSSPSTFQAAMFRNFAYVNPDSNYIFWHSSFAKQPGGAGGINFGQIRSDELDQALDTAPAHTG